MLNDLSTILQQFLTYFYTVSHPGWDSPGAIAHRAPWAHVQLPPPAPPDIFLLYLLVSSSCISSVVGVTSWLKKLFNDAPIPQYEVNERTVDILHEIVECNEESDKDAMLVIEDMKDRTSKYEAEAEYWHDILRQTLGFFENSLFGEVTSDLVRSAMDLEVENTSLTSFYSVLNDMTLELYKTKSKNDELEHKLKILMKKLTSALMVEKQLEKDIEKVEASQKAEQAKAEIHFKNLKFLEDKSKDMKIRIADAENELVARGLDKSLTHEALMKSSEELAALRKKMEPLKMELASYLDLPPSILLAQVKVEEAKRELKVLDEELSREIEAVPFELL